MIAEGTEVSSPVVARRRVARRLRAMRERAGLSLGSAASGLDLTRSALNRVETGRTRVSVHLVRSAMDLYDQYVPDMLGLVRASRARGWWQDYVLGDAEFVAWESGAARVWEFAATRVPGLLRTDDYARALVGAGERWRDEAAALDVRRSRLVGGDSLRLHVVVDEAALLNQVGGSAVMRAQLDHIAACAEWPGVRLRVLPASSGAGVRVGEFRLLDFDHPEDPPVVFLDTAVGVLREEGTEPVAAVRGAFEAISSAALSEDESRAFVEHLTR